MSTRDQIEELKEICEDVKKRLVDLEVKTKNDSPTPEILDHEWCKVGEGEDSFDMGKYAVTNSQYREYINATGHRVPKDWKDNGGIFPEGKANHPVVNVSYYEARKYCAWLSEKLECEIDLPTDEEWSQAAGDKEYPWGDGFDKDRCNSYGNGIEDTVPVNALPNGAGPYGNLNLSGNVWEWTKERKYGR
jgi:formylglycine-generating enzyme required for sulfatase activity